MLRFFLGLFFRLQTSILRTLSFGKWNHIDHRNIENTHIVFLCSIYVSMILCGKKKLKISHTRKYLNCIGNSTGSETFESMQKKFIV
jgi:hypothetical protein